MTKKVKKVNATLVDTTAMRLKIKQAGYRLEYIKTELQMTYVTLQKRINGQTPFTVPEMVRLCEMLNIGAEERDRIFKLT